MIDFPHPAEGVVRVEPNHGWTGAHLRELWVYRELIWFLTLRDLKVRYKQTILGASWALLQPLMGMVVFTVILGKLAKLETQSNVPYSILTFCALLPWQLFSGAITQASTSLVSNERLVTKVYFPRLIMPISAVLARLADFGISIGVLFLMMLWYRTPLHWVVLAMPLCVVATVIVALAGGVWLSAMNVKYRDVGYLVPFIIQLLMWVSPVAYPSSIVHGHWRFWYFLESGRGNYRRLPLVAAGAARPTAASDGDILCPDAGDAGHRNDLLPQSRRVFRGCHLMR